MLGKLEEDEKKNGEGKTCDNFVSALQTLVSIWEYVAMNSTNPEYKETQDLVRKQTNIFTYIGVREGGRIRLQFYLYNLFIVIYHYS